VVGALATAVVGTVVPDDELFDELPHAAARAVVSPIARTTDTRLVFICASFLFARILILTT
jgi:hypothetical protein